MSSFEGHPPLAKRLHRRWRQVASGASFVLFGAGALVVGGLLLPPIRWFVRDAARRQRLTRAVIGGAMRFFWNTMLGLGLMRCRVHGAEHLRQPGVLIVANHPTLVDAVLLLGLVEDAAVVAKQELARNPLTGPLIAAAGYIVNDDGCAMVQAAAREFARGGRVLIFPESTRTRPGAPVRLRRGAANIAVRTGCRVVVVTIAVSDPVLYKGAAWHAMPMDVPRFEVVVRPPLDVAPIVAAHGSVALAARDLNARLQGIYDTEMSDHGAT
jgi:1-acyl-sn-glycerol-3-phosphate acyltransferase